jgi:hypothetical protein
MIGSSAPAWAVWLALGLWGLAGIVGAVAFVMARRLWRDRLAPMLMPMLATFTAFGMAGEITGDVARCDYLGVEGDRCELPADHDGPHEWSTLNEALRS